jgi:tRNA-specific 2-thiouridylase
MNSGAGKKVFVGMSGGVDSAVVAALLKEQGYAVTGVFIKVWDAPWLPCNWRAERRSAMHVAAELRIPFRTLDLEAEYKRGVVDYMIAEYAAGRIPNPDVFCNKVIKFGGFYEYARKEGADFIATGHYARTEERNGVARLLTAVDAGKEQSYFLWNMSAAALAHTLFPIGELPKSEVRKLAEKFSLPNALKKDSQGICFLGPVSIVDFLKHYVTTTKGDVLDEQGKVIGVHEGALFFTIGQRHGFVVHEKTAESKAFYVVRKDMDANTITVAPRVDGKTSAVASGCILSDVNFLAPKEEWGEGDLVIRYHGQRIPLRSMEFTSEGLRCIFARPVGDVALGQSGVYYKGDECMGGGIIRAII